jgi:hypothetical protein
LTNCLNTGIGLFNLAEEESQPKLEQRWERDPHLMVIAASIRQVFGK